MKVWPFGAALRGEAPNRLMLRWLKTVVVSDEEKAPMRRQVGTGKTTAAESVETLADDTETGTWCESREEPGGRPLIGQVVSGVEAA
jgi:hypothetical protein